MQNKNKVLFGQEAVAGLKKGIDVVYNAVSQTLGAAGKNVIYRSDFSRNPVATNDGVTIAKLINLEEEIEAMGADYIKQAAEQTNTEAGDGTTTAVVLSHALVTKGLEMVKDGVNPMKLRREIFEAVDKVIAKIKKASIPIKTDQELFNVANVSMENPEVAEIIVGAVKKAGKNGEVIVEESSGLKVEREDIEGLKFDRGFVSPYMATNFETMEAVLEDVYVLVTDKSFTTTPDIFPILEALGSKGVRKLFIVCENVVGEALGTLLANKLNVPKAPFITVVSQKPYDNEILEDIAILTGADALIGAKLNGPLTIEHIAALGKAKKVIVTKDKTLIQGGAGSKKRIEERIKSIQNELAKTEGPYRKEILKERIAKLAGGLVLLKVGAPTESDMKYMKLKVDDAVSATRAALEEGIVAGGGRALYDISLAKPKTNGEEVVFYACGQPIRKIIENSGENVETVLASLKEGEIWDALNSRVCANPIKNGIIDPAKVERCALKNAASMAATFITQGCVVVDVPQEVEK